ncbi:MAG: hypothetical protein WAV92_04070, partial [Halopseudomonas yangmingensis]
VVTATRPSDNCAWSNGGQPQAARRAMAGMGRVNVGHRQASNKKRPHPEASILHPPSSILQAQANLSRFAVVSLLS